MTACESLPNVTWAPAARSSDAEAMPSARSRSVVGQRQHQQRLPPSRPTSRPVTYTAWTAVNGWSRAPASASSSVGVTPVLGGAPLVLRRLLGHVGVQHPPPIGNRPGDLGDARPIDGAHGVDGRTDADAVRVAQLIGARRPRGGVAVGEPSLCGVELDAGTAAQVARVEQGDAQTGLRGGGDQRLAHRVRRGVRHAARPVVQVVELADGADAGERHLGVRRPGEPEVRVRIEPARRRRTSAHATSRTIRHRRACGRAGRGGRRGCGRWRSRAPSDRRAESHRRPGPRRRRRRCDRRRPSRARHARLCPPPSHASSQWYSANTSRSSHRPFLRWRDDGPLADDVPRPAGADLRRHDRLLDGGDWVDAVGGPW